MLNDLGNALLIFTLISCGYGLLKREDGGFASYWVAGLITAAFATLMYAYVVSDFSVLNAYENSHSDKSILYKVSGTWGNHEGSMLLWVWVLAVYGALFTWKSKNLSKGLSQKVIAIQLVLTALFTSFIFFTSNPFVTVSPTPAEGLGLNPLLQDPALAIHPPLLYLGYVGYSLTFSLAVAALWHQKKLTKAWAKVARVWGLVSWMFLTLGILAGSYWAYYELGWGGWWFWDPVENASLMPWLTGTALMHSLIAFEKRNTLHRWTLFLCLITFALSLLGTFLVRSGILVSVHTFAADPERGLFILGLFALMAGSSLALFAARIDAIAANQWMGWFSREASIVLNNLILGTACVVVTLGTLYPVIAQITGSQLVSIGPPYFEQLITPLAIIMFIGLIFVPFLKWQKTPFKVLKAWGLTLGVDGGILLFMALLWADLSWLAAVCLALVGAFGFVSALQVYKAVWGRLNLPRLAFGLGHLGLGVAVVGMIISAIGGEEKILLLGPDESVNFHGYTIELTAAEAFEEQNYLTHQVTLLATYGRNQVALQPEKRFYPLSQTVTTETAIETRWFSDLYVVHGGLDEGAQKWIIRLYYNPMILLIWLGGLMIVAGGGVSLAAQYKQRKKA